MFSTALIVATFFLVGVFCITYLSKALTLSERESLPPFTEERRFFYRALLRLQSSAKLMRQLALAGRLFTLGYGASIALALVHSPYWLWSALGAWIVFFTLGELLSRMLCLKAPQRAPLFLTSCFLTLAYPFTALFLKGIERSEKKMRRESPKDQIREVLYSILQESELKDTLGNAEKKLLASVIKFQNRIVREVMVPRVDLFSLPIETSIKEATKALLDEGYSRVPIYKESVDNIVGILMFKDVLELYLQCANQTKDPTLLDSSVEILTKSPLYTPETKSASHLLQEFKTKQNHLAIVVDEYGGTEGVVTIEDLLEEIVGEIADEYDLDEEELFEALSGGNVWIVDARMNIFDAEEAFGISIPQEGEYDTIGGYLFHEVGSIPQKGYRIHQKDFDLEVLRATERSVEKVKITKRSGEAS